MTREEMQENDVIHLEDEQDYHDDLIREALENGEFVYEES